MCHSNIYKSLDPYIKEQHSAIQQSVDAKLQPFRRSILVPHGNTNYVIMHLPTCYNMVWG